MTRTRPRFYRPRCARTGKIIYRTEAYAEAARKRLFGREIDEVSQAYPCSGCGGWHVGHLKVEKENYA